MNTLTEHAEPRNVAVLVGSLRRDSYTRRAAQALAALAGPRLLLQDVEIGALLLYNEDLEGARPPEAWTCFRQRIAQADAVLFATPEYSRSVPAALKNAIDVGSRPRGENVWQGKPAAVVSASPGTLGGFGANHHLRQALVFIDMPTMQQPELYIARVDRRFNADGGIVDEETRALFQRFLEAFAQWIEMCSTATRSAKGR